MFDEEDGTLDGIETGAIQATVVQKPFQFGYLAASGCTSSPPRARRPKAALPPTALIDTGVDVIDKANVAAFSAEARRDEEAVQIAPA